MSQELKLVQIATYLSAAAEIARELGWDWHRWMKETDLMWKGKEGKTTQEKRNDRKRNTGSGGNSRRH
jgi:hypothetical protein